VIAKVAITQDVLMEDVNFCCHVIRIIVKVGMTSVLQKTASL